MRARGGLDGTPLQARAEVVEPVLCFSVPIHAVCEVVDPVLTTDRYRDAVMRREAIRVCHDDHDRLYGLSKHGMFLHTYLHRPVIGPCQQCLLVGRLFDWLVRGPAHDALESELTTTLSFSLRWHLAP